MYKTPYINSRSVWELVEAWLQLMDRIILTTHLDLKPENKKVLLQKLKYSQKYCHEYTHKYSHKYRHKFPHNHLPGSKTCSEQDSSAL